MDYNSGRASAQLPLYQPTGHYDAYQQALTQHHDTYLHLPPAQHHDPYQQASAVQHRISYPNVAPHHQSVSHHYDANPSQQPLYEQSYYQDPLSLRYGSSQSHYQAVGTEAETRYLRSSYAADGAPGATAADVGGYLYQTSIADSQRILVKGAIRQFGEDPILYGGSAFHAQPSSTVGLTLPPLPMGMRSANSIRPRNFKNIMKKKKAMGPNAASSQSAYCQVCKVQCNTQEVLKNHKAGKKHKKNLENLKESISMKSSKPSTSTIAHPSKTQPVIVMPAAVEGSSKSKKKKSEDEDVETKKRKVVTVKPAAVEGSSKSKKKKSEDDVETKKRKVLECGAPEEGVKICTLCNVVCNSPVVLKFHLAGHKHKAMVAKQQEEQVVK